MAFNSYLGRVLGSIRAVGAISAVEKRSHGYVVSTKFRGFGTSTGEELLRAVESDINNDPPAPSLDVECPFEMRHGYHFITLARKYKDELIELEFDKSSCDPPSFPIHGSVYRSNHDVEFEITATPNKVEIHSFTMRDAHLEAFEKYLEDRGIHSTMKALFEHIDGDYDDD
ncbi:uncharacterized protein [Euphorbia lathyris]|uniref:uncharacterized protein n=1 Tax=Euphorbia lathyris TaxID=212925 RepID=UPI003313784E